MNSISLILLIFYLLLTGVEDETHFLLQCPVLENKRTQIINNIKNVNTNFNNLPNKSKLICLMSSEDNFINISMGEPPVTHIQYSYSIHIFH
jgi:hypothetical protein